MIFINTTNKKITIIKATPTAAAGTAATTTITNNNNNVYSSIDLCAYSLPVWDEFVRLCEWWSERASERETHCHSEAFYIQTYKCIHNIRARTMQSKWNTPRKGAKRKRRGTCTRSHTHKRTHICMRSAEKVKSQIEPQRAYNHQQQKWRRKKITHREYIDTAWLAGWLADCFASWMAC